MKPHVHSPQRTKHQWVFGKPGWNGLCGGATKGEERDARGVLKTNFFFCNFFFSIIGGLQCSVNFLLYSKVTHSHIHIFILWKSFWGAWLYLKLARYVRGVCFRGCWGNSGDGEKGSSLYSPPLFKISLGVPLVAQQVMNPTSIHEGMGSIPDLAHGVKDLALLWAVV